MKKIFAINLGSTTTKVAYYEDDVCVFERDIQHSVQEVQAAPTIFDQYAFRKRDIVHALEENDLSVADLDAFVSRGGLTEAVESGAYRIDEAMLGQIESGRYGLHPCGLGCRIAYDLAQGTVAVPITVDTPSTCEMDPVALYTGLPGVYRKPASQPLNSRAVARAYAAQQQRPYEDMRLIVVNLGGGITVTTHRDGRMVDTQDGTAGDGPFCTNRCNGVPVGDLVKLCFSGTYSQKEMLDLIYCGSGLVGYLGEFDVRAIEEQIAAGSKKHEEVLSALCYQVAKEVGAHAAILEGRVDAVILTGGMAKSAFVANYIKQKVSFVAPVVHMPGQLEMEALCLGALRALTGQEPLKDFASTKMDVADLVCV